MCPSDKLTRITALLPARRNRRWLLAVSLAFVSVAFIASAARPWGANSARAAMAVINVPTDYPTIQQAINAATNGDTIQVAAGTYIEDININKTLIVTGAGVVNTTISGAIGGDSATVRISANNVEVSGFKITREGNNTTDWNNAGLNSAGVAVQGATITGMNIHDNLITQNRTGIDLNNSNGHTIRNNVITDNRTGLLLRNQTDNLTVVENEITNNWTVGVLFLDGSGGTNSPPQQALNSVFFNNNISGNWYGQIVDRQSGGSLPAPGTNLKNFSGNWLGTTTPVITTANSAEPGYAAQIPFTVPGGTATPPGGQPDVAGPASANFDITPLLGSGTDTNVETTPGRGTYGFQGNFGNLVVSPALAQSGGIERLQEGINLATAGGTVNVAAGTFVIGSTINANKANLTIKGAGSGSTILQVTGSVVGGYAMSITGMGTTLQDLQLVKTDLPPSSPTLQNLILINANNVTIQNNVIQGQDPGSPWSVNGWVFRGLEVAGGLSGLLVQNNTFRHLRQPAYINGPTTGQILNNNASGTRGWVVAGAQLTFSGNTWGPPANQGADIALLASVNPAHYPNLAALSAANNNAFISGQLPGRPAGAPWPTLMTTPRLVATAALARLTRRSMLVSAAHWQAARPMWRQGCIPRQSTSTSL